MFLGIKIQDRTVRYSVVGVMVVRVSCSYGRLPNDYFAILSGFP